MSKEKLSNGEKRIINAWNGNIKETAVKCKLAYGTVRNAVTKDYILEAIQNREEKENSSGKNELIADRQERQAFWSSVMRGDKQVVGILTESDKEVEIKDIPALKDRLKAAELLGKSNADFVEKRILATDPDNPLEFKQKFDTVEEVKAEMKRRGIPMEEI